MDICLFHIGLILSMLYFMASTASWDDVSTPNDVTFGLNGMFYLFWEWKFSSANCSLNYVKVMKSLRNGYNIREKGLLSKWEREIERMDNWDLNGKLSLFVKAECDNITIDSLNKTVQLAPGDEGTTVKNFRCVWYYPEYVKCNWEPGPRTPQNTKYRVFYWIKDKTKEERLYKLTEFWDLLETGRTCELVYPTKDMKTVECQFLFNERVENYAHIAMVVTDMSKLIKPYIYYKDAIQIAKLKPPQIFEAYRTSNNTIYVSWNKSQDSKNLEYELLLTTLSSRDKEQPRTTLSSLSLHVLPDVTYTVKVRVKLSSNLLSSKHNYTWSEWSKEKIIKVKGDEKLTSIIIPLIISAVVIIAAVFLLVHMEKLKAVICPQIPDPGRIFSKDLQQWLKTDVPIVYSKPEKEEICPVYLIERPSAMKCV